MTMYSLHEYDGKFSSYLMRGVLQHTGYEGGVKVFSALGRAGCLCLHEGVRIHTAEGGKMRTVVSKIFIYPKTNPS